MNLHTPPNRAEIEAALGLLPGRAGRLWLWRALWLVAAIVVLTGGLYAYRGLGDAAVAYETMPATRADLVVTVSATGTVQPITQVDIGSEMSGVVREVLVDDNSLVRKGDTLAVLDTTRLRAQRARTVAQHAAARARLADASAALAEKKLLAERQIKLRKSGLSTEQDADTAKSAVDRAAASVEAAAADVAAAAAELSVVDADLTKSKILSPIDGIVLKRVVEPGQTVAASLQAPVLFTIAQDLTRVQLEAAVDEADIGAVKLGQQAIFTVDAWRGRNFPAKIERLSFAPATVDGVVTYKAVLSAANEDLALRPGMTATAKIVVQEFKQVLTVPNEALRYAPPRIKDKSGFSITQLFLPRFPRNERPKTNGTDDGKRSLWLLRNDQAEEVKTTPGASDGKRTIIADGIINDGDALIVAVRQPQK